jgi:DNA primase
MSVTQQIKDKLDIVQYIGEYVPSLKKAGRYYKACCPFHGEKSPSFVVNPDTQSWRCFGACAEGGDIFTFAQKLHGWDFAETVRELGQRAGVEVKKRTPQQEQQEEHLDKLRGMLATASQWYHDHLLSDDPYAQRALFYTEKQRGFTRETINTFEIGYAPVGWSALLDELKKVGYSEEEAVEAGLASRNDKGRVYDRFRNRLMIPIRDERGRVIGFGARALDPDDNPKYLNSPQSAIFDKSGTLFGLDVAKRAIRDSGVAVIVEGYMDVIQAHQAGYNNVVAQMGTAMTEAQLKLLTPRYADKIIMALDADAAGQNATRRSLEVARETLQADYAGRLQVDLRVMHIDGAKDPDDVLRETPEKWAAYVANALPVADFVIGMETAGLGDNASMQERQTVAQNILPILAASENNLYKKDNLQKLALRLHIPEGDLLSWAEELRRIEKAKKPRRAVSPQEHTPPVPADEYYASMDEPPPHFDFDEGDLPPDYDEDFALPSVPTPTVTKPRPPLLTSRHSSRAAEAYCLRMLLQEPTLLSQINRKFRELAQNNDGLTRGPLCDLTNEDFTQGDYRALLSELKSAISQDDVEPMDYLREGLDDALLDELNALLLEEQREVHRSIGMRLSAEFEDVWKQFARRVLPGIDAEKDLVRRALKVRHQRLEREQQEIRFLLEDAQRNRDKDAERMYFEQTGPVMRALVLIQRELGQLARF